MNTIGLQLQSTSHKPFQSKVGLATAKKPVAQKSQPLAVVFDNYATTYSNGAEFKSNPLTEGFVLDGYFLGTFEFDSLTGHPDIRY